jgi:PAS domain S-box-containing protein
MHRLLHRQLKKFTGRTDGFPEDIQRLLGAVSDAYSAGDDDRALIERSMDLSSRELLERNQELALAERKYRAILESAIDCIIAMSHDGKITEFNPAAEHTFGYSRHQAIGQNLADLIIPPDKRDAHWRGLARYLQSGNSPVLDRRLEVMAQRKDGSQFPVEMTITRINLSGSPVFSAYLRDITQRRQAESALRHAHELLEARVEQRTTELAKVNQSLRLQVSERERAEAEAQRSMQIAEQANRAKSDFLANMSHEIRTPMTAILGFTDMLLAPDLSPTERLECINTIRCEGEHLLAILNDILDLSKIESGKVEVERMPCKPAQIVTEAVSFMRVRASEKGIKLSVTFAAQLPGMIQTDPTKFRQILLNLIGNAIKFTPAGGVQVVVSLDHDNSGPAPRLRVEVIDSGIGMNPQQLSQLFRPFTQADASTTRRFGGTGLGLAISKRLAQMLGGDIAVHSCLGHGSRFILTLESGSLQGVPLMANHDESATIAPAELATSHQTPRIDANILLAEDGVHNQRVIAYYLRQAGARVTISENGRIACEKAIQAAQAGQPFDLIVMDMQMPELDGYAATAALRAGGFTLPIIALTAHTMSQDRDKCLKAGCSDYLTKPIDKDVLLKAIAGHLAPVALPAIDAPSNPAHSLRSTTVHEPEIAAFLSNFVNDLPAMVTRLSSLLAQSDLQGLRQMLHQLKGTAGLYGFMPLTDQASLAERHLKEIESLAAISADIHSLLDLMRRVEGYQHDKERAPGPLNSPSPA